LPQGAGYPSYVMSLGVVHKRRPELRRRGFVQGLFSAGKKERDQRGSSSDTAQGMSEKWLQMRFEPMFAPTRDVLWIVFAQSLIAVMIWRRRQSSIKMWRL